MFNVTYYMRGSSYTVNLGPDTNFNCFRKVDPKQFIFIGSFNMKFRYRE